MTLTIADESALLTDFYQLTMLQAYADRGMNETAVRVALHRGLKAIAKRFGAA